MSSHSFVTCRGLVPARRWKEPIPTGARLTAGTASAEGKTGRIWYAELQTGPALFVFERNSVSRQAAAVYSLPAKP